MSRKIFEFLTAIYRNGSINGQFVVKIKQTHCCTACKCGGLKKDFSPFRSMFIPFFYDYYYIVLEMNFVTDTGEKASVKVTDAKNAY